MISFIIINKSFHNDKVLPLEKACVPLLLDYTPVCVYNLSDMYVKEVA